MSLIWLTELWKLGSHAYNFKIYKSVKDIGHNIGDNVEKRISMITSTIHCFITLIPCNISFIILTRLSFSFICLTCKAFNFVAMNAFKGIRRIITKIPAKTLGPKIFHKNTTHNIIWNGALHNMLKKGILKKWDRLFQLRIYLKVYWWVDFYCILSKKVLQVNHSLHVNRHKVNNFTSCCVFFRRGWNP